jgi:hypothetical protein
MTITPTAEATGAVKPAMRKGQLVALKPPRLPYHEAVEERFGIDRAGWKALVEAIYPNAETADAIIMALSYCRARNLDPFKRPVHIVPMWSSVAGKMIETVWPGISELRTTAFRTGQYAGMSEPDFGPMIERTFKGAAGRGKAKGEERSLTLKFPEWCRVTITRETQRNRAPFRRPQGLLARSLCQIGRHRCAERHVGEPSGRAARKMRRGRRATPRFPGRDRQRAHRRGNGRSAHPRGRGPRPGQAEAGKRHAPKCWKGAQTSPAARVATTVSNCTIVGRASPTGRRPAGRRSRNPPSPRARF